MKYTEWRERCNKKNPKMKNLHLTIINNDVSLDKKTVDTYRKMRKTTKTIKPIKFNLSEFKKKNLKVI